MFLLIVLGSCMISWESHNDLTRSYYEIKYEQHYIIFANSMKSEKLQPGHLTSLSYLSKKTFFFRKN